MFVVMKRNVDFSWQDSWGSADSVEERGQLNGLITCIGILELSLSLESSSLCLLMPFSDTFVWVMN